MNAEDKYREAWLQEIKSRQKTELPPSPEILKERQRAEIIDLMKDGRERTCSDIMKKTQITERVARQHIDNLVRSKHLCRQWACGFVIYRLDEGRQ